MEEDGEGRSLQLARHLKEMENLVVDNCWGAIEDHGEEKDC